MTVDDDDREWGTAEDLDDALAIAREHGRIFALQFTPGDDAVFFPVTIERRIDDWAVALIIHAADGEQIGLFLILEEWGRLSGEME